MCHSSNVRATYILNGNEATYDPGNRRLPYPYTAYGEFKYFPASYQFVNNLVGCSSSKQGGGDVELVETITDNWAAIFYATAQAAVANVSMGGCSGAAVGTSPCKEEVVRVLLTAMNESVTDLAHSDYGSASDPASHLNATIAGDIVSGMAAAQTPQQFIAALAHGGTLVGALQFLGAITSELQAALAGSTYLSPGFDPNAHGIGALGKTPRPAGKPS